MQHIKQHDFSGFRTCKTYAQELGMQNIAQALDKMHRDATNCDEALSNILIEWLGEKAVHPFTDGY